MTIRPTTLERIDTELLLRRLQKDPGDDLSRTELRRRGEAHLAQATIVAEAEDRFLETMPEEALAARAYALDRELGDLGVGGLA
jgi:hypothetical protein